MEHGTIKIWVADRGYGFVKRDNGERDLFLHISNVVEDVEDLKPGQRMKFEVGTNPRTGRDEAQSACFSSN